MDFLDIRKKAKERAQARATGAAEPQPAAPTAPPPAPERVPEPEPVPEPVPSDAPVVTDVDVLEGALAARLQGLREPDARPPVPPPGAADARFTTWRPGTGAPPALPPEPPEPDGRPAAHPEDFAVVAPEPPLAAAVRRAVIPVPVRLPAEPAVAPAGPAAPRDPLDEFFYRDDEEGPTLPEIAAAAATPEALPAVLAREELLTFLLGDEEYAVAIERVREVVRSPPITEVPRAPSHILGVVTVRGEVVAVIDPRRRLGLAPATPAEGEGKIVIVDAGDGPCGLHVDRVASVVRLHPGSIEPCPQGIAGQRSEFLAGIGRDGDRLFTVLDLGALLRRTPARSEPRARRADGDR